MIRATTVVRRPAVKDDAVADAITLDHHARHRRRLALKADGGTDFLLDLDKATALDDGDAVKLEDGRLIRVKAAPEDLVEVTAASPLRLLKVAWHLGNRHVPAEVTESAVYVVDDPALTEMVRGLGAAVAKVKRPFRPEKGAYEAAEAHGQGHDHGHEHHGHEHHGHEHHGHEHGPDCGCGHDHDHAHAHDDAHEHAHDHAHAHGHDHAQGHDHDHGHAHGADCGCVHDHNDDHGHTHGHKHG